MTATAVQRWPMTDLLKLSALNNCRPQENFSLHIVYATTWKLPKMCFWTTFFDCKQWDRARVYSKRLVLLPSTMPRAVVIWLSATISPWICNANYHHKNICTSHQCTCALDTSQPSKKRSDLFSSLTPGAYSVQVGKKGRARKLKLIVLFVVVVVVVVRYQALFTEQLAYRICLCPTVNLGRVTTAPTTGKTINSHQT